MAISKKFLIVIPARKGSKGIPNKNFRTLGTLSLIDHSLEHAMRLRDIADIIVSTDNHNYLTKLQERFVPETGQTLREAGGLSELSPGVMSHLRSEALSRDETPIVSVIQSILEALISRGYRAEYEGVVLLQPTSPFRSNVDLAKLRDYLLTKATNASSFVTFRAVSDCHPARMYFLTERNEFKRTGFFAEHESTRRQDLPAIYLRDGCYYYIGLKLVERGLQVGPSPEGFVRVYPWTINLDGEQDWILAESVVSQSDWKEIKMRGYFK